MSLISRLIRRLLKPFASRKFDAREFGCHTLRDIGLDPMAVGLGRETRLRR